MNATPTSKRNEKKKKISISTSCNDSCFFCIIFFSIFQDDQNLALLSAFWCELLLWIICEGYVATGPGDLNSIISDVGVWKSDLILQWDDPSKEPTFSDNRKGRPWLEPSERHLYSFPLLFFVIALNTNGMRPSISLYISLSIYQSL